jgi:hypothetical protein
VRLSQKQRAKLLDLVKKGKAKARTINRAHAFLLSDAGQTDDPIAAALQVHPQTVRHRRQHCAEEGLEAALDERPRKNPSSTPRARPR